MKEYTYPKVPPTINEEYPEYPEYPVIKVVEEPIKLVNFYLIREHIEPEVTGD